MINFRKNWILILVLMLISNIGYSQTTITGPTVSGSWTTIGSPYNVTGNITIPPLSTLTIGQNVTVNFGNGLSLTVTGTLIISGTSGNEVLLTATNPGTGWAGIDISSNANTNTFDYCIFMS